MGQRKVSNFIKRTSDLQREARGVSVCQCVSVCVGKRVQLFWPEPQITNMFAMRPAAFGFGFGFGFGVLTVHIAAL